MNIRILSLHGMFADIQSPDFFVHGIIYHANYIQADTSVIRVAKSVICIKKIHFSVFIFAHRKQQPFKRNKDETETDFTHLGLQPASDGS